MPAEVPRTVRKLNEPKRKMSLRDRFLINGKVVRSREVIVVGGGFAGLSAAYELESLGYRVTVLEGQEEVGGRVQSCRKIVPGNVMEKGAELDLSLFPDTYPATADRDSSQWDLEIASTHPPKASLRRTRIKTICRPCRDSRE